MKVSANEILISNTLTVGEFVKKVKEKTGNQRISNATIHYHLTDNSEKLDFVDWCGLKMIIQNDKANNFCTGKYNKKGHE